MVTIPTSVVVTVNVLDDTIRPSAFQAADWTLTDNGDGTGLTVDISAWPLDNGQAITTAEYSHDLVTWEYGADFGGTSFPIPAPSLGNPADVYIRATNQFGPGPQSDLKTVTPTEPTIWAQNYVDNVATSYLKGAAGQLVNASTAELSIWVKPTTLGVARNVFYFDDGASDFRFRLESGEVNIRLRDETGTDIYAVQTTNTPIAVDRNSHIYFSIDRATDIATLLVDGVAATLSVTTPLTPGPGVIRLTGLLGLFASGTGTNLCDMQLSDVFFESGHALHGYNAFVDAQAKPIDITQVGNPDVLKTGNAATYNDGSNQGGMTLTVGQAGFVDAGAPPITTAPGQPADGSWALTNPGTGDRLNIVVSDITDDGGLALVNIWYSIDGGAAVASGLTGPGTILVTGLTQDQAYTAEIYYENSLGDGPLSNPKGNTPTVGLAAWYTDIWDKRTGTGLGWDGAPLTDAATWAAATSGVSQSGEVVTISVADFVGSEVDFRGYNLISNGINTQLSNCVFDAVASPGSGRICLFNKGGDILDSTFDNSVLPGDRVMLFNASSDPAQHMTAKRCHFIDVSTDAVKGPAGNSRLTIEDCAFDGGRLATNAHLDFIDLRSAGPGTIIRRCSFFGRYSGVEPDVGTTGMNNMVRQEVNDNANYVAIDITYEECIFVGSDNVKSQSVMLTPARGAASNVAFSRCLMDKREHGSYMSSANSGIEDWDMTLFDAYAADISGTITLGAHLVYPNISAEPATAADAPTAPAVTGGTGQLTVDRGPNPWNRRGEITSYDLRHSADGTNWATVNNIADTGEVVAVPPGTYEVQTRAVNVIGAGNWSLSGQGTAT